MNKGDKVVIVGPLDNCWEHYVDELDHYVGERGTFVDEDVYGVHVLFDDDAEWRFEAKNVIPANSRSLRRRQEILAQIEELIKELKEI